MLNLTVKQLAADLAARRVSSVEVTQYFIKRINALGKTFNAFISVDEEQSLASARTADQLLAAGKGGPLTGIPLAHKDIFCAKGWLATCGSKILSNFVAPYDAHVIERFNQAGAVIAGKTNMDEFAMGSSTETSFYGPVKNPWDTVAVPGGSSGGSAAAVAARLAPAATGTDSRMLGSRTSTVSQPSRLNSAIAASTAWATSDARPAAKNSAGKPMRSPCNGCARLRV